MTPETLPSVALAAPPPTGDFSARRSLNIKRALTGEARIKALESFIGCFEGPGDLSVRHSEYFTEALLEKQKRIARNNRHDTD